MLNCPICGKEERHKKGVQFTGITSINNFCIKSNVLLIKTKGQCSTFSLEQFEIHGCEMMTVFKWLFVKIIMYDRH